MKINVGSKNLVKVKAVEETIKDYIFLSNSEVLGLETISGVSDQPKSLEETIVGAQNRALKAFVNCDYSFGIEDGLMSVPHTKTGYMNVCVCAIYDGQKFHLGISSAFEYPKEVMRLVIEEGLDVNQAFYKKKLTDDQKIGSAQGAVGILTHSRLSRKDCTKQAIVSALIHLENKELY